MSVIFLTPIDLAKNELQNAVIQNLPGDPSGGALVKGFIWFNSMDNQLKYYDGSTVQVIGTGTPVSAATTTSLGTVEISVPPISSGTPIAVGDNDPRMTDARTPTGAAGGDATGSTFPNITIATVGGASAANIADAATKRHTQNTDTGTTSNTFQVGSGSSGPQIVNNGGVLEVKDASGTGFADLKANNIYVNGELIEVAGTVVKIGDQYFMMNDEITTHAANSNSGMKGKRLASDNVTRVDWVLEYDESTGTFKATAQHPTTDTATVTHKVVREYPDTITGDGSTTSFSFTHNLNNAYAEVAVYDSSTGARVYPDATNPTAQTSQVQFAVAPANALVYAVRIRG